MFGSLLIENQFIGTIFGTGLPCSIIYNGQAIEDDNKYEEDDKDDN